MLKLLEEASSSLSLEVEREDDVASVIALTGSHAFDVIIISNLLGDRTIPDNLADELRTCAIDTPILVVGYEVIGLEDTANGDTIRQALPSRLTSSTLLREIRFTLENHVLEHGFLNQERRLACLQCMFSQMLEMMPYAVAAIDSEGFIVSLNETAEKLWSGPVENAIGTRLSKSPQDGTVQRKKIDGQNYDADLVRIEWLGSEYFLATLHRSEN